MEAIFLLAGLGSRISKLTKNPKCLLKINNEEIILRNLRLLKKYKIKNITIVLGYRKMVIKKTLMKLKENFNFKFAYNNDYKSKGNSFSLFKGLKKVDSNCLIFDGDLVFSDKILSNFLKDSFNSSFLVGKTSIKNKECAKVLVDNYGNVKKTIDKRLIKKKELIDLSFVGEAVGIIKISNRIRKIMLSEFENFFKNKKNIGLNWEHFMNYFLVKNPIKYNKTFNSDWIEIDNRNDYYKAVKIFKKK